MTPSPVIFVLGDSALPLARKIKSRIARSSIHGLEGRADKADVVFGDSAAHLQAMFSAGRPVIGLCASAILIRCLAPMLSNKQEEPYVLALSEDGKMIVPLLGGHHGGNAMANELATFLDGTAALTTAGETRFNIALDQPPEGLRLANPRDAKQFMARLLAGEKVRLDGGNDWLAQSNLPFDDSGSLLITVTERSIIGHKDNLVFHPQILALGIGCERHTKVQEIDALVRQVLSGNDLSPLAVGAIVSIDLKEDETALHQLAMEYSTRPRFFSAERLEQERERLQNPSDIVFAEVGCHGVAEGAALAATGANGHLRVAKVKSARATLAVGQAAAPLIGEDTGRPRGKLSVIGIGPGMDGWRTPEASQLINEATDLVAYGLYLDLLGTSIAGKTRHEFDLGEEEARVRAALELAAMGKNVALISSGDIGIYAMATLVFELMSREQKPQWQRLDIQVAPGISALQAAAARAGAPLGHDFCTISLSDLLTPWEVIEKRIQAAADGDFVIAFYNPVSKRRRTQLAAAKDILLTKRPNDTPVIIARNLGRRDEKVTVVELQHLDPEQVDMLTLVMVGSSDSKIAARPHADRGWVYTPRGYAGKMDAGNIKENS